MMMMMMDLSEVSGLTPTSQASNANMGGLPVFDPHEEFHVDPPPPRSSKPETILTLTWGSSQFIVIIRS